MFVYFYDCEVVYHNHIHNTAHFLWLDLLNIPISLIFKPPRLQHNVYTFYKCAPKANTTQGHATPFKVHGALSQPSVVSKSPVFNTFENAA